MPEAKALKSRLRTYEKRYNRGVNVELIELQEKLDMMTEKVEGLKQTIKDLKDES